MIMAIAAILMLGLTVLAFSAVPEERRVPVRVRVDQWDREEAMRRRF